VVATTFMLELYDPERFHRSEEVASYLGLAPMVRHRWRESPFRQAATGGTDPTAKFTDRSRLDVAAI